VAYVLPWAQFVADQEWVKRVVDNWGVNAFQVLVQLAPNTDFDKVSAKIASVKATHAKDQAKYDPESFSASDEPLAPAFGVGKRRSGPGAYPVCLAVRDYWRYLCCCWPASIS
jgi:hypothetical protein